MKELIFATNNRHKIMEVSEMQSPNAEPPMPVTLSGITTEVRYMQQLNAEWPMLVTLLGIEYEPTFPAGQQMSSMAELLNKTPFMDLKLGFDEATFIAVSEVHCINGLLPILVTLLGIVMEVSDVQL